MGMLIQVIVGLALKLGGQALKDRDYEVFGRLAENLADKIPEIVGKYGSDVKFGDIDWQALKMPKFDDA